MHIKDATALTHTGVQRTINEDAVLMVDHAGIFAVADGMGGAGAGDTASLIAMSSLQAALPVLREQASTAASGSTSDRLALVESLELVFQHVDHEVHGKAQTLGRHGMATTLVTALVVGDYAYIAHVGDSRAYLLRDSSVRMLTDDHSIAMLRFRQGRLTAKELRSSPLRQRLYQVLGAGTEVDVDTAEVKLADDDVLLLCSDGLHAVLDDATIRSLVRLDDLDGSAAALINAANEAGGPDNISVTLVRVGADEAPEDVDRVAQVLGDVFLFRSLGTAERHMLAPYLQETVFAPGEVLFEQGEPGDSFYVIVDGSVRISRGDTHLVDVGPGQHFGELSLARPIERSATATALTGTRIYGLHRDRFHEITRRRPTLGATLSVSLLDNVGDRLREMTDRIDTVERVIRGELRPSDMTPKDALLAATSGRLKA